MGRSVRKRDILFVAFFLTRANFSVDALDPINACFRLSNAEGSLDLRDDFVHCVGAVAGSRDQAMNLVAFESRIPGRIEAASVRFSGIAEIFCISLHTGLKHLVARLLRDTQL